MVYLFKNTKRELKELEFHESYKVQTVKYLIFWFDNRIIQKIGVDKDLTLKVRIRILCGLINNTLLVYLLDL